MLEATRSRSKVLRERAHLRYSSILLRPGFACQRWLLLSDMSPFPLQHYNADSRMESAHRSPSPGERHNLADETGAGLIETTSLLCISTPRSFEFWPAGSEARRHVFQGHCQVQCANSALHQSSVRSMNCRLGLHAYDCSGSGLEFFVISKHSH